MFGQTFGFLFQCDEAKLAVVKDNRRNRQIVFGSGQKFTHQHVECAVTRNGDDRTIRIGKLRAIGAGQGKGHCAEPG